MNDRTPAQRRAIETDGNVLVVAGAGAGKTSTLVDRCLARLLDPQLDLGLDQILMVTFTEAAAAEMKERIRHRLAAALQDNPGNSRLEEQAALLDAAHICTLHSFCFHLIRQHFFELKLDPQLVVLAEEQAQGMMQETFDRLMEDHYAGKMPHSPAVQQLISGQARGQEHVVRNLVLKLHHYTRTLPDPEAWFQQQLAHYARAEPDSWQTWLMDGFTDWRALWLPVLKAQPPENTTVWKCAGLLENIAAAPQRSEAAQALAGILEADQNWPDRKKTVFKKPVEDFFSEASFLHSVAACGKDSDPLREDWNWVRGHMETLLQLAREFSAAFSEAKREQAAVDFHDFEQFALDLLWDRQTHCPKPLARQWREKLRFVFVDEYQDINAAQDAILTALSREGHEANRFLVGDVKQSIYRFRLAAPRIFQRYKSEWARSGAPSPERPRSRDEAAETPGGCRRSRDVSASRVIALSDNFRSREALLDFANAFFSELMRPEIGGVDYDDDAALHFGATATNKPLSREADPQPCVEIHLRLKGRKRGENEAGPEEECADSAVEELTDAENEARLVAQRLGELKRAGHQVWNKADQQFRPMTWRDVAVLLRSPASKAEIYSREFAKAGIPLEVSGASFYENTEVSDLVSLLMILDNPLQDVPLLAVLRSPLVGLSLDELAEARLALPHARFWTSLCHWHQGRAGVPAGPDADAGETETPALKRGTGRRDTRTALKKDVAGVMFRKVDLFLERYNHWRRTGRDLALAQRLENILDETFYFDWLLTQSRGPQRQANVRRLLMLAQRFDPLRRQGLPRFLKFIESQQEAETDVEPPSLESGDAVRLTSIHRSKGLEFPVVVVPDWGKRFNLRDMSDTILLDEQYGLCPEIKPPQTGRRYPSLPYWLAQLRQRKESLGEELRLLYVAMTRARDTLLLAGTASQNAFEKWQTAGPPCGRTILKASSPLDWLGPWLARQASLEDAAEQTALFKWRIHSGTIPVATAGDAVDPAPSIFARPSEPGTLVTLDARLGWKYPFAGFGAEAAKTSVSALRKRAGEDEEARPLFHFRSAPASPGVLDAADIGTAHHVFLQFVSLELMAQGAIQQEIVRMRDQGLLTGLQAAALDSESLAAFWQSDVGRRVVMQRDNVRRELPFTARFSPRELCEVTGTGPDATRGEFVVVQGVIDLAVLLPDQLWLVDFKTDRVTGGELQARAETYRPQLLLYARALERIYHRPVRERWLHFLSARQTVPL